MAADLNMDVRVSVVGSTKGSDNDQPWVRRLAESFGAKYTFGSTIGSSQANIVAYNTFPLAALGSINLNLQSLAAADSKTYAFTSVAFYFVSWDDMTANAPLSVTGTAIFSGTSSTPMDTSSGSPFLIVQPGGFWCSGASPNNQYLVGGAQTGMSFVSLATSPATSNFTYIVIGIGSIV